MSARFHGSLRRSPGEQKDLRAQWCLGYSPLSTVGFRCWLRHTDIIQTPRYSISTKGHWRSTAKHRNIMIFLYETSRLKFSIFFFFLIKCVGSLINIEAFCVYIKHIWSFQTQNYIFSIQKYILYNTYTFLYTKYIILSENFRCVLCESKYLIAVHL